MHRGVRTLCLRQAAHALIFREICGMGCPSVASTPVVPLGWPVPVERPLPFMLMRPLGLPRGGVAWLVRRTDSCGVFPLYNCWLCGGGNGRWDALYFAVSWMSDRDIGLMLTPTPSVPSFVSVHDRFAMGSALSVQIAGGDDGRGTDASRLVMSREGFDRRKPHARQSSRPPGAPSPPESIFALLDIPPHHFKVGVLMRGD